MSKYGEAKKEEHLAIIRRILVENPNITITDIRRVLQGNKMNFTLGYISSLIKKVRGERARRYDRVTKMSIIAEFEDLVREYQYRLKEIAKNKEDDRTSVMAIKQIVENRQRIIDLAMDLGVIDRKLGSVDVYDYDVLELVKIARKADEQRVIDTSNKK